MDAFPASPGRSPFWADLNVFTGLFLLGVAFGGFLLVLPANVLARLVLPRTQAEGLALPLAYALWAAALAGCWHRWGLSPRRRRESQEGRFRRGHGLLALGNAFTLAMFVAGSAGVLLQHAPQLAALALALGGLAPVLAVAGLLLVFGARAPAPAAPPSGFPDTRPASGAPPAARKPRAAGRAGGIAIVVLGLAATTLLAFVGLVFAATGFTGSAEIFMRRVVPAAVAAYAVYLLLTIVLVVRRRAAAARWLAWGPALLVLVVLPAWQFLLLAAASLLRR